MKGLDPNQDRSQLIEQGTALLCRDPSAWGAGDGTEPHVLGALAAPAPPEHVLCSYSHGTWVPVSAREASPPLVCIPLGQGLIAPSHVPYTDKTTTEGCSSVKSKELFQKKQHFHGMAQRSQPQAVCSLPSQGSAEPPRAPGDKGTVSLASSNITIHSSANTFWCSDKNPKLSYIPALRYRRCLGCK